jgi:hypothetical protein
VDSSNPIIYRILVGGLTKYSCSELEALVFDSSFVFRVLASHLDFQPFEHPSEGALFVGTEMGSQPASQSLSDPEPASSKCG